MLNIRFVDTESGYQKFHDDKNLYNNMLLSFDKITLDESLKQIYSLILKGTSLNKAINEAKNLQKAAQTVEAQGLSMHVGDLVTKFQQNEAVLDRTFHALAALDGFIEKVFDFKDELKAITKDRNLNNQQTVKEIQYDIRSTLHNYNVEYQNLARSGVKAMNISQINQYQNHSELTQASVLAESVYPDYQNQNQSYYTSVQKLKRTFQGQNQSNQMNDNLIFKDELLQQQQQQQEQYILQQLQQDQIDNQDGFYNEEIAGQQQQIRNPRPIEQLKATGNDEDESNPIDTCQCTIF